MNATYKTSVQQLELSERPWVSLQDFTIDSPLTFDKNGAHVTIAYKVKNSGRSPAVRGFWQPDSFLQFLGVPDPIKKRDAACKFAAYRSTKVTDTKLTETWFPGESIPRKLQISFDPNDIANALQIPERAFPTFEHMKDFDNIYPALAICVAYRAAFTDAQYRTGYILLFERDNPKTPYIPPLKSGQIPASELKLVLDPFYGIYAE